MTTNNIDLIVPKFYEKQKDFLTAKSRYVAFGGSRL